MTAQPADISMFSGEVHPYAAAFPMLPDADLDALAADIKANGLLNPIILDQDGRLLDGRNRLEACDRAGVKPTFDMIETEQPIDLIVSANVNRRHMTATQRMAARAAAAHAQGKRIAGSDGQPRWARGSLGAITDSVITRTDRDAFNMCGKVADHDPALLVELMGGASLEGVLRTIEEARQAQRAAEEAREAREARRAVLAEHGYTERISDGQLTEDEAWTLYEKQTEADRKAAADMRERIRKFNIDVGFALGVLAPLSLYPNRIDQVRTDLDPSQFVVPVPRSDLIAAKESIDLLIATIDGKEPL